MESKSQTEITNAVKDVLKECILTKDVNVDSLPTFDIEYIFLNIRSKSIGEAIKVLVTCPDDGETEVPVTIYVDEIKVVKSKEHKTDIVLMIIWLFVWNILPLINLLKLILILMKIQKRVWIKLLKIISECIDTIYTQEDAWGC